MATTITFAKGATSITLPAPPGGYPVREVKHQATGLTLGGKRYVYDKGVDRYEAEINLESLDATQKSDLDSFFHTTARGGRETFTYTDSGGTEYAARFLDAVLEYSKAGKGIYDVTVRLDLGGMHS